MRAFILARDRFRKDLRRLDPNSQEYWEEILRREGLSMSRGIDRRLSYASQEMDTILQIKAEEELTGGRRTTAKQSS